MIEWDQKEFEQQVLHEVERISAKSEAVAHGTDGAGKNQRALALTFFDELTEPASKPWLIKNVIA
jgi:hypothetical protein